MKGIRKFFARTGRAVSLKRIDVNLLLAVVIIVLVNIVGQGAYMRADLTAKNVYSLTPMSTELMGRLDRPMKAKVFFTADVPARYSSVRRYVQDIMKQYDRSAGGNLEVDIYPMRSEAQKQKASEYGVRPVHIREISGNEFQETQAYMSVVLLYGDRIEKIDGITSTKGLEYNLTTTMLDMVNSVNAFAGLEQPIKATAYVSRNLEKLEISGMDSLIPDLKEMLQKVKKQTGGKMNVEVERPEERSRIEEIEERYGLKTVSWEKRGADSSGQQEKGILGIVLNFRDSFEVVPINIEGGIFGYKIEKTAELRKAVEDKLAALVQTNPPVAYVTGHGEKRLQSRRRRTRGGASGAALKSLLEELYQLKPVNLSDQAIPGNVKTVLINGPRKQFSEYELYQLDQFLMRGGSLLVLTDPFQRSGGRRTRRPQYKPVNTGLGELLSSYGITPQENYVMDTRAYVNRQQNRQDMKMYNAPMVSGDSLHDEHLITRDLARVLFLNSSSLSLADGKGKNGNVDYTRLARSSEESWLMKEDITLNPMMMRPPSGDKKRRAYTLAVLAEGRFSSHFEEPVKPKKTEGAESGAEQSAEEETGESAEQEPTGESAESIRQQAPHLQKAKSRGTLLVAGTSALGSSQLLGNEPQRGSNPNRILIQNMVDYLNGNTSIPPMRTKGLQMHRIGETTAAERTLIRMIHVVLIPLGVVAIGIAVWLRRRNYQRSIQRMMEKEVEV
jgi:ABC-type uncharacterized transport system involved in gliding motility auxiliary subunit